MDVSEQQEPELLLNVFTPKSSELHLEVYALVRPVPFLSPVSIILSISNHCLYLSNYQLVDIEPWKKNYQLSVSILVKIF